MEKCYLEKIPPDKYKTSNLICKVGYFLIFCISLQSDFTTIFLDRVSGPLPFNIEISLAIVSISISIAIGDGTEKGAANFQTNTLLKSNSAYYIKRNVCGSSKFTQVK